MLLPSTLPLQVRKYFTNVKVEPSICASHFRDTSSDSYRRTMTKTAVEELWVAEDPLDVFRKRRFHKSKITICISVMEKHVIH